LSARGESVIVRRTPRLRLFVVSDLFIQYSYHVCRCYHHQIESNRKYNALESTLRRHDVIAMAERRRRNLVTTPGFEGCRCCYDPNSDGGEYLTLIEYKKQHPISTPNASTFMELIENETKEATSTLEEEYDDDTDDEFDYLLDEGLPGGGGDDDTLRELEENRRAESSGSATWIWDASTVASQSCPKGGRIGRYTTSSSRCSTAFGRC
jgi:hypothetical protein